MGRYNGFWAASEAIVDRTPIIACSVGAGKAPAAEAALDCFLNLEA